jgi:hypothetical protein
MLNFLEKIKKKKKKKNAAIDPNPYPHQPASLLYRRYQPPTQRWYHKFL